MRLLTKPELHDYQRGYRSFPGSQETDHGVLVPEDGCAQAAADWLWDAGAPDYIALAFGDYYHQQHADTPEPLRPAFFHVSTAFWYDPVGMAARSKRGQELDVWPGKYEGAPCPTDIPKGDT